jgi:GNAT superfamily N-acetyltransferase
VWNEKRQKQATSESRKKRDIHRSLLGGGIPAHGRGRCGGGLHGLVPRGAAHGAAGALGRRLLDLAKERADGLLELWTFQVNAPARRFYERNGFVAVELTDGTGNEEREPDMRYRWAP